MVFDIQRFAVHDGPGIRCNVFLKGCPLHCAWCHNPEGIVPGPQLSYLNDKCTGCGQCAASCPHGCHRLTQAGHVFNRAQCTACGLCAENCYFNALELVGKRMTAQQVFDEVQKDLLFYETSAGGLTLSGGEPLFQPEFALAILQLAKAQGISTCVETSGFCSAEVLQQVLPHVDLFLYDIKLCDAEKHQLYTGVPNAPILRNLALLSEAGAAVVLRCPIIPCVNDNAEHAKGIAGLANAHGSVTQVELEPYHPLGQKKRQRFGQQTEYTRDTFLKKQEVEPLAECIRQSVRVPVIIR